VIISFGWTTPALLAGQKTVTRREWNPKHAAKFKAGMLVDAWNTSPRNVHMNPRKVATIRIVEDPYLQSTRQIPDSEWDAEGFEYLSANGLNVDGKTPEALWFDWRRQGNEQRLYVVRFEVVEYLEGPLA
jgi:hypothetical protein